MNRGAPSWYRVRPRHLWALGLLILLAASTVSAQPEEVIPPPPEIIGPPPRELPSAVLQEEQTQNYLKAIITSLKAKLALVKEQSLWRENRWNAVLRNHLIDLSMWWKFADLTTWTLRTFGDHETVRELFFFAMPFLEWMIEPFVILVTPTLPEGRLEADLDRLTWLIKYKQGEGMAVSIGHVSDASQSEAEAKQVLAFYQLLIRHLAAREGIEAVNLSVNLSALAHGLDKLQGSAALEAGLPEATANRVKATRAALGQLLQAADEVKEKSVFIRLETAGYADEKATLALFKEVVAENPEIIRNQDGSLRLGVVIQACRRDVCGDLEDLLEWARRHTVRVPVRLVKASSATHESDLTPATGDAGDLAWSSKEAIDASFERLSEFLILHRDHFQIAFATHNLRSIARAMALAGSYGLGRADFEFQMRLGLGDAIKEVVTSMGYRLRVYVPIGAYAPALAYAGSCFRKLADKEDPLTRALSGDTAHLEGPPPQFHRAEGSAEEACVEALVAGARAEAAGTP